MNDSAADLIDQLLRKISSSKYNSDVYIGKNFTIFDVREELKKIKEILDENKDSK